MPSIPQLCDIPEDVIYSILEICLKTLSCALRPTNNTTNQDPPTSQNDPLSYESSLIPLRDFQCAFQLNAVLSTIWATFEDEMHLH